MVQSYWRTVSLVTVWQISASICYYSVFAATPFFRDAFGLSRFSVGVVVTMVTLGYAVFLLPLGALVDRFGERLTLSLGLVGLATGAALVAGAPTYALLLAAVFFLGSLYGTAMPGTNKAVFDNIEPGKQNLAMGIKQVGVTGGSGISALLVTGLAGVLFWQAGFLIATVFGLVVAVVFYRLYSSSSAGGTAEYPDFRVLLSNQPYVLLTVAGLFLGAALFTTTGYTILYVDEAVGATVVFAGITLAGAQVSGSVGRIVVGWLADRLSTPLRTSAPVILCFQAGASFVLFLSVTLVDSRLTAFALFAALGFFVLGWPGIYYSYIGSLVPSEGIGSATAGGQIALNCGALVTPPVFGYLVDVRSYAAAWIVLALAALASTVLFGVLSRRT